MKAAPTQFAAIGLALASYTLWVLADTGMKIAGASRLPAYEVVAALGCSMAVLLLVSALWRRNLSVLWPRRPGRQVLRSTLDLANNLCVVIALRHLSLALFYILIFFSPMITTLLAAAFLGERLGWRRAIAVLTGFAGVILAVNPFGKVRSGDWIGYLACMVCVLSFSANMVWSRVIAQTESAESLTFVSAAVAGLTGAALLCLHAEPVTLRLGAVLALAGLCGVVGSLCLFVALRSAPASTVAQYHYSQLLAGAAIGHLIWGERLTAWMLSGAVLIIGAGIYTATRTYGLRASRFQPGIQTLRGDHPPG